MQGASNLQQHTMTIITGPTIFTIKKFNLMTWYIEMEDTEYISR
jgi:hypothetical protein